MKRFMIRCEEWNDFHAKFSLFDAARANCGLITIRAEDVLDFISKFNWNGSIDWNGKVPDEAFRGSRFPVEWRKQ